MEMVKEMEAQERGSEVMSSEKKEKDATMGDAKRESDLLQAHAALSSSNLKRGEIASAFAMQVKMLKIRSQQLEERAANDANEAKVTSQRADEARNAVIQLEKVIREKRHGALGSVVDTNEQTVRRARKEAQDAKEAADEANVKAEQDMVKAHQREGQLASDEDKNTVVFKREQEANNKFKDAEKLTAIAARRSFKANANYAKAKYDHALENGVNAKAQKGEGIPDPPAPNMTIPGHELVVRLAAQEKNVADLELEKAKVEEEEAKAKMKIAQKEAIAIRGKDGKSAMKAELNAHDAVAIAAKSQEKANELAKEENAKIKASDKNADIAVQRIMNGQTGLSRVRSRAKEATDAAAYAEKRAAYSAATARRIALKLNAAIDRSVEATKSVDRQAEVAMRLVVPDEQEKAKSAWKRAAAANEALETYKKKVDTGSREVNKYGKELDTPKFAQNFAADVDEADDKLKKALSSITSSEKRLLPEEDVAPETDEALGEEDDDISFDDGIDEDSIIVL